MTLSSKTASDDGRTFAVLGGKGFVGSAIVRELQHHGNRVTVIDKDEYRDCVGDAFDVLINANGNSKKYLAAKDPAREFDLSVASVAHSLQDFKCGVYVHLSTIDVYPDHANPAANDEKTVIDTSLLSPYGMHKYLAEQLVRYYADNWLIFRMAGFVGPKLWKNSIYDMLTRQPLRVNLDSEYQYLHTSDLAKGIVSVIEQYETKEIFNIAGDGVISLREIAEMIPGYDKSRCPTDVSPERYEVNIEKISKLINLPKTSATVRTFIQNVMAGKESITASQPRISP